MSNDVSHPRISGRCPGCGHFSLFVGMGGHVACGSLECRDPTAADRVLHDGETEHIVLLTETNFSIQHPLRERGEDLFTCTLHERLSALDGPPARLGRYRVSVDERRERLVWEDLP